MANAEHLERLKQGVEKWNQWRSKKNQVKPELDGVDLRGADLRLVNLGEANLSEANLDEANLSGANLRLADLKQAKLNMADLIGADLSGANLDQVILRAAILIGADLSGVTIKRDALRGANLIRVNLSGANLERANLSGADLTQANLSGANLNQAKLNRAGLNWANLSEANLSGANLSRSQALGTCFKKAIFTGACLEDWHINSETAFEGAICNSVYLKSGNYERRPREGVFNPGEFAALFQQAVDTIDLIFKDGIDWQAFFQSFQDLRTQYADQDLSIQAIEKKCGGAFVVRVEVAEGADKSAIEGSAKDFYETKLVLMEQRYRTELSAKDSEIFAYKRQSASMESIAKLLATRPVTLEVPKVTLNQEQIKILKAIDDGVREDSKIAEKLGMPVDMVRYYIGEMQKNEYVEAATYQFQGNLAYKVVVLKPKGKTAVVDPSKIIDSGFGGSTYDLRGAQFGGGYVAGNVEGNQYGGIINNYGLNTEDIIRLLTALRDQAQIFPTDQKDDALDALDLLERDLADEQPDQGCIGRRLKKLAAILQGRGFANATMLTIGATAFTADLAQLADVLNVPLPQIEQVQPEQLPPSD